MHYFTGSPLVEKDLKRVNTHNAKAIFILSVHIQSEHADADKKSIIEALSIRQYCVAPTILQIQSHDSLHLGLLARPTLLISVQQIKLVSIYHSFSISIQ